MRDAGKRLFILILAFGVWHLAFPPALRAGDWSWELPIPRYKQLNVFQRAQVDKAADLVKQSAWAAAASEFEKFKVQFPDSPALSYVLFMRGYCLHQSKTRNAAIKAYHEVLDYFADEAQDAAAAQYFMGLAHLENGDTRNGLQCMKQLLDDERYKTHPLAAGALAALADNHWRNKEFDQAVKCWKQIVADFAKTNHTQASRARDSLTIYYIKNRDYAGYENWMVTPENRDDAEARKRIAQNVIDRAHHQIFPGHTGHYSRFEQKERWEAMKACFDYFASRKPYYERTKDLWDYYSRAVPFLASYYQDKKLRDKLIDECVPLIKALQDKTEANNRYAWLVDRLREGGDYERARYCAALITDPPHAAYKDAEVYISANQWPQAIARLQDIEKMGNATWTATAQDRRAWIYKDCTHEYEKAIELYRQINKPPSTLWHIQECFIRMGKLDEAINTLSEIENSFPSDAPRAAWYKASYFHEARQAKKAIAQARKILKAYKAAPEASQAHQLLEQYGVATGGGVFDEEDK